MKLEKITRFIQRKRSEDFTQIFPFCTYDTIFSKSAREEQPNFKAIFDYFEYVFKNGIPHRSKSASGMPELELEVKSLGLNDYCDMAKLSGAKGNGHDQHPICERYFMDNHSDCIGTEVPVYNKELSAFIDILLIEHDPFVVKILDYKPGAKKEKKASTQLYWDRELFCDITGVMKEEVECYYFDDEECYQVIFNS